METRRSFDTFAEPLVAAAVIYLCLAYLLLPFSWNVYFARHPALQNLPNITATGSGHPGDPINVALIGSREQLQKGMRLAGWVPADPLGVHSDLEIAEDTVLDRPYPEAPVSDLFLWGRKEDLAFEQPVGGNPRHRHHVRFWKSEQVDDRGLPLWAGSVTYDKRVGLSYTTGQITHHIDGNIDSERDRLANELKAAGSLTSLNYLADFHPQLRGFNGGGDAWHTDGRLAIGTLAD